MPNSRRRDGREVAQHPKGNRSRRPRGWHRGLSESLRWMTAAGRIDTARLCEQLEDLRAAADPVMADLTSRRQTGRQSATERHPQQQQQRHEGRR